MKEGRNRLAPTEEEIKMARLRFLLKAKLELLKAQEGLEHEPEMKPIEIPEGKESSQSDTIEKKITPKEGSLERRKRKELEKHFQNVDEKLRKTQKKRNKKSYP